MKRPSVPIEVIIEITGRCQQVCPYCTGSRLPHVPLKNIEGTFNEAASLGIKALRITGGEPLLHPDIRAILHLAKSKKFDIILNTSADNIAPALMKTIITTIDVGHVSLQGYDAGSNASYTHSKQPFVEKIKNIFLLKTYLPTLWIATVITVDNVNSFDRFLPLVKKINPAAWLLQRPISMMNEDLKQMDNAFYKALGLKILKAQKQNINAFISNPIPLCTTGDLRVGQKIFLGAQLDEGHLRIVRSAKGFFKPSYFLETNLGDNIKKAWGHPFMRELNRTDYLPEICQRCPALEVCRGGCRAMAFHTHGTALAEDPLFNPTVAEKALLKIGPKPSALKRTL